MSLVPLSAVLGWRARADKCSRVGREGGGGLRYRCALALSGGRGEGVLRATTTPNPIPDPLS